MRTVFAVVNSTWDGQVVIGLYESWSGAKIEEQRLNKLYSWKKYTMIQMNVIGYSDTNKEVK